MELGYAFSLTYFSLLSYIIAVVGEDNDFIINSALANDVRSGAFCHDPKGIPFGRRQPEFKHVGIMPQGAQLHFSCLPGYVLHGSTKMVCGSEGKWEPPTKPICRPVTCPEPQIENGEIRSAQNSKVYHPGSIVNIVCNHGYQLDDKYFGLLECHMTGVWMRHSQQHSEYPPTPFEQPTCVEITCPPPPQLTNSEVRVEGDFGWDGGYVMGSTVTYRCHFGYQIEDLRGSQLICRNGQWKSEQEDVVLSKCVKGGCSRPLPIINGDYAPRLSAVYPFNTVVTYYCYEEFSLAGNDYTFRCTSSGTWSPSMVQENIPICQHHSAATCDEPAYIEHGTIVKINGTGPGSNGNAYPENTVVRYACDLGYRLQDCTTDWVICKQGRWVNPTPKCVDLNGCGKPPGVPYAIITYHEPVPTTAIDDATAEVPLYSKIHYKCLPGFILLGSPDLTCGLDGCWAPNLPQCILLGPPFDSSDWKTPSASRVPPPQISQQNDISWTDTHLMTVSVATAGSIIGALLLIQLIVIFQRRKCCHFFLRRQRLRHQHPHYRPRRSCSSTSPTLTTSPNRLISNDPDRVALIAFADGVQVMLPTYEEAMRQSGPPPFDTVPSIQRANFSRSFTRRPRGTSNRTNSVETMPNSRPNPPTRHSSSSTSHSTSMADNLGSTDTMTASDVSTAVTIDTLSSTASNASQQLSCRAMCGSLTSFDTTSMINGEGEPLLEEIEVESTQTNEHVEMDDVIVNPTSG